MRQWGCLGLVWGIVLGLLLVVLLVFITRPPEMPASPPLPTIPSDTVIFISENTLSQQAAATLAQPAVVDTAENGVIQVTTPVQVGAWQPVVQVEILLSMEGPAVVSRLRWARLGFLTVPASWLPDRLQEEAAQLGPTIQAQTPPDFSLVGLTTSHDGLEFQLKWTGSR